MDLSYLSNLHDGERGIIFGCGPSLDRYPMESRRGRPAICLNRSIRVVPGIGPTYLVVLDDPEALESWYEFAYPDSFVELLPKRYVKGDRKPVPVCRNYIEYKLVRDPCLLGMSRGGVCDLGAIYWGHGAAGTAAHFAWLMGWAECELVGIDGGHGVSEKLRPMYSERDLAPHFVQDAYDRIKDDCLKVLSVEGIPVRDFSKTGGSQ